MMSHEEVCACIESFPPSMSCGEKFAILKTRFTSLSSIECARLAGYSGRAPRHAYDLAKSLGKVKFAPHLREFTAGQIKEARKNLRLLQIRAQAEALLEHVPGVL